MSLWIIIALIVAVVLYVRLGPTDVSQWHVDPISATKTARRNQFLMRDGADAPSLIYHTPPVELATAFNKIALSKPNVTILAGNPTDLWVTYIQRSKLIGYPDFISVRIVPTDTGGAKLVIYSRSRFGRSDLGVNRARVLNWTAALGQSIL
jgi:uncharacterized protein (DUF1499 family)